MSRNLEEKPMNHLQALQEYGQSVWLDYIRRNLMATGELGRLIEEDGLRGVTSNPAIFEKAITGSMDYKDLLSAASSRNLDAQALYEKMALRDIQDAADLLRPIYDKSKKRDGQYDFNLTDIAEVWRRGSVVASWLLDLTTSALLKHPDLAKFSGRVSDSGEGRWTIAAAIDEGVPAPVLSAALYQRFSSRGESAFADKVLSAMRYQFGDHEEKAA